MPLKNSKIPKLSVIFKNTLNDSDVIRKLVPSAKNRATVVRTLTEELIDSTRGWLHQIRDCYSEPGHCG